MAAGQELPFIHSLDLRLAPFLCALIFPFNLQPLGAPSLCYHTDTRAITQAYLHTTTLRCHLIIFHSNENILSFLLFDWKMKDSVLFFKKVIIFKKRKRKPWWSMSALRHKSGRYAFCSSWCCCHCSIIRSLCRCKSIRNDPGGHFHWVVNVLKLNSCHNFTRLPLLSHCFPLMQTM